MGNARKQTNNDHHRIHNADVIDQPKSERTDRAEDKTEQNELLASESIGQRAAQHTSNQAEQRRHSQQDASLRHPDAELLRDVESEERKEQRATDAINKSHADDDPKKMWKLAIDVL